MAPETRNPMDVGDRDSSTAQPSPDESGVAELEFDRYVNAIGKRIRGIRARRGMTRKDLAKHSVISERYLAQAESGKANISIALLWRIAQALQVKLIELLPEDGAEAIHPPLVTFLRRLPPDQQAAAHIALQERFATPVTRVHGVALIGLRGAGKSRLGELLAEQFGVPFIRIGDVIEEIAGMKIGELFSLGGQKGYRRFEKRALEHVIGHHPVAVVEAGGSIVSQAETLGLLLDSYYTVWIKASPAEHMKRVMAQGDTRPMEGSEQAMEDLVRILAEREPEYRLAHYILDTSGRSILDCCQDLANQCEPYLRTKSDSGPP